MPGARSGFRKTYDHVRDREPERGRQRRQSAYHLHLQTIEWAAEQIRQLCEKTQQGLIEAGRDGEAQTIQWLAVKMHGLFLREHETQRKALNRATKRDREAIEIEMKHTKQRANELNALLDEIEKTQAAIKEAQRPKIQRRKVMPDDELILLPEPVDE